MTTGSASRGGKERFQELDVFRGLASFWVLFYHYVFRYRVSYGVQETPLGWFAVPGMPERNIGELAVYWFFMISGFVIVWTIEGCSTWKDFALSRFSRLFPSYWTAVLVTAAVGLLAPLPDQHYTLGQIATNMTMVQEVFKVRPIDGVYWSLLYELIFYVMMGSVFALGWIGRLEIICLIWALASVATHLGARYGIDVWWTVQKYGLLLYGHFFAAGVMFFLLWRGRATRLAWVVLALCLVSIALTYPPPTTAVCVVFFTLFGLATTGRLRWITVRPLLWLGTISYPLYLIHQMIGYRIIAWTREAGLAHEVGALAAGAVALGLAHAIVVVVEQPALRLIRSWWRGRKAAPVTAG